MSANKSTDTKNDRIQKSKPQEKKEPRVSIVVVPSRAGIQNTGGQETEVAAQIIVPTDGGWAWVVLFSSFWMILIIDGTAFTYGSMINDIAGSFKISMSIAAVVNSIQTGIYYLVSPLASALINRFGFRTVAMLGSIICCIGLFATFFSENILSVIVFLGFFTGIGDSLINMSASLIIGFYFEKRRALAMAISLGGSSIGTMSMYPINSQLVKLAGWKATILLQAGLHGLIYFLGLTFKPLLALTVTQTEEDAVSPTRTVTFLPTMAHRKSKDEAAPNAAERVLGAVSNAHFPTAANMFDEKLVHRSPGAGTSASVKSAGVSRITLHAQGTVSKKQLQQMQSMVSRIHVEDSKTMARTEITVEAKERPKTISCFGKCCDWEEDLPETRPMYRDDAFFQGSVKNLPVYQKSVAAIKEDERTGLEYQLAVTRAIAVNDLQERPGVCSTAVRRVLVSMVDPSLLKKKSYILLCLSGLMTYSGFLVPFVYIQDRNLQAGVDPAHCSLFVSVMSIAGLVGRFILNALAAKVDPTCLYIIALVTAGLSTVLSDLSNSLPFQYGYCVVFGAFSASVSGLRSLVIVSLYGLENLTNATGVLLLFLGIANIYSTPMAGSLKSNFGYRIAFYVSGLCMTLGGLFALPVRCFANKENTQETINNMNDKK